MKQGDLKELLAVMPKAEFEKKNYLKHRLGSNWRDSYWNYETSFIEKLEKDFSSRHIYTKGFNQTGETSEYQKTLNNIGGNK